MFVRLMCKASRLKKRKLELLREKQAAYNEYTNKITKFNLKQKYRRYCVKLTKRLKKCCSFPKKSCLHKLCFNIKHEGTCENFTLKSIAGFFGGFFLTYIFFMFFVLQLNFTLSTATIMCSFLGSILTIGLAFSYKVRCIVFLVLPQFFSKKGRQALLAYAYILAITGPGKNALNNMSILGESLACGQEQLKAAVKQILEVVKKPFYAIKDAIKAVVKAVKEIVIKIKEILLTIKRIIMSLIKIIKAAFDFIAKLMNFCNKEIGTPFQRCQRVFEDAITDCNAKLGPLFNWLCNITYLVKSVCYIVKVLDFVCVVVDFIKDTVSTIVLKVKQFVRHIRTMFYVRIKFSHSYHFESNHSKSMADITTGIVTEIKQRASGLIKIFDFMSSAASIFFIFMVFKVIYYRHKFLTNEIYDNKYITKNFRQIDLRRAQLGLETVLPLNHRERKLYITTSSMRLVKQEKSRLSEAAMILLMSTLKLSTHMATDYSLYWIMTLIRYYGRFQSKIPAPNIPGVHIEGEGFLANLLKGIVKAFQPIGLTLEIDTVPCLPDPIPPDYDRYIQIVSCLVLCWFLAIFEPYGLRFRHSVMCYYNPQRARERAIWLYNHIMRSRCSFLKFARRQLRRKVKGDKTITKVTCMEFIRAKLTCRVFRWLLGTKKQNCCLLCGEVFREGDNKISIKCQTPNCPGLFCEQCFADLHNLCTVCLDPIQYGDLSDISEEKDSSEEEDKLRQKKKSKKKKKRKKKKKKYTSTDNETTDDDDDDGDGDKTRLLLKDKNQETDSDYYSSSPEKTDVSTDYSYSYQENKDITLKSEPYSNKLPFTDVEKQNIPEYASMENFRTPQSIDKVTYPDDHTDITTADEFNTTSTYLADFHNIPAKEDPNATIPTSLEHLNDAGNMVRTVSGSKLSLQYSQSMSGKRSQTTTTTTRTESQYSKYSNSPISDYDFPIEPNAQYTLDSRQNLLPKKSNSKISTESIDMEILASDASLMQSSARNEDDIASTETSFISSPSKEMVTLPKFSISRKSMPMSEQNLSEKFSQDLIDFGTKDVSNKSSSCSENIYDFPITESTEDKFLSNKCDGPYGIISDPTILMDEVDDYETEATQRSHPDVPTLNLDFLNADNQDKICSCESSAGSNKSSCNCRLFKNSVKFSTISETKRSPANSIITEIVSPSPLRKKGIIKLSAEVPISTITDIEKPKEESTREVGNDAAECFSNTSSSLISSLFKLPKTQHFSVKPAKETVSVSPDKKPQTKDACVEAHEEDPSPDYSPITTSYPESNKISDDRSTSYCPYSSEQPYSIYSSRKYDSPYYYSDSSTSIITELDDLNIKRSKSNSRPDRFINYKKYISTDETVETSTSTSISAGHAFGTELYANVVTPKRLRRRNVLTPNNEPKKEELYKQRIRDYYRQLPNEKLGNAKSSKIKENPIKKFLKIFKSNKKNTLL